MLIKRDVLEAIRDGRIDLVFRRWKKATVKPGGTLRTAVGMLSIGAITPLGVKDVTERDVRRAGFADLAAFRAWLDTMKEGDLCKIEIGFLGEDPRIALRNAAPSAEDIAELKRKIAAMDRRADKAWTAEALHLIARDPGRRAEELAGEAGLPKPEFKARIARLKALGLTVSLETGYRLSPRGEALVAAG